MKSLLFLVALVAACVEPSPTLQCHRSRDCSTGVCVSGTCRTTVEPLGGASTTIVDAGADSSRQWGAKDDSAAATPVPPPCADAVEATADDIVLNEVLVNVPAGPAGDANADGVRDPYDDEFVELANVGATPVDMTGVSIYSGTKLKFWFEPFCLLPGASVVVFGGGSIGSSLRGPATVSDTRFAFGNDGGTVRITTGDGVEIARLDYTRSAAASLTRTPQLVGNQWVPHTNLAVRPFSPGTCPDGTPIATNCVSDLDTTGDAGFAGDL